MNYFVIADPLKCIGCRTCMIACVVEHSEEDIFYQDPQSINFNPKLEVVKNAAVSAPIQCRQCEDAPCAKACPHNAISKENNSIKVNNKKCIGCKNCMLACPFGAINLNDVEYGHIVNLENIPNNKLFCIEKMVANKCDLCSHSEEGPACLKVCPTSAFKIVKEEDLYSDLKDKRKAATAGF
ncbi:MAG: 4Fe-4S dicluster domain-containing protein [Terrisporobacter sp.]|uniref:4Fe-4S dicluster domain-containing protein n=1 Tax=Terrisporobacter sp. TaxID=1965305 RepID=UPI002FCC919D